MNFKIFNKLAHLLFIAAALLIATNACKKEQRGVVGASLPPSKAEKIKAFNQLVLDGAVNDRSGENVSVEEGVWDIEALLNARYAHADQPFLASNVKSDTITVSLTEGLITPSNLASAFEAARQMVAAHYMSITAQSKHLVLADVRAIPSTGSSQSLEITTFLGIGQASPAGVAPCDGIASAPFGLTDDWWFGFGRGKCCLPNFEGSDAAEELEKKLNQRYPLPVGHGYFTDIESKFVDAEFYPNPDNNGNPLYYYLLYRRSNPTAPNWYQPYLCITPEDMNWYYCNWWDVIGECKPPGKHFASINIYGDATSTWLTTVHKAYIFYGVSVSCEAEGPCPPTDPDCIWYICKAPIETIGKWFL